MAHKCINTQDLIKSNEHWGFFQWVTSFKKKTKSFCFGKKEKGSLGETPMIGFHIWKSFMCERAGEDLGHGIE